MTQLVAGSQDGTPRRTGRRGAAAHWLWGQVFRSAPPLLWSLAVRESWHVNVAIAGLLFLMVGEIEARLAPALAGVGGVGELSLALISLSVGLGIMVAAGYLAARVRPAAATAFAAITATGVAVLMITSEDNQGFWNHLAFLILCPLAALAGRNLWLRGKRTAT